MSNSEREQWDAIVVGAGLGGLTCAAYLAARGKRTLVLESHYVAGGNTQTFRRKLKSGLYEFDVGVHYIGGCGKEGSIARILRGAGLEDRVNFRPLDPDGFTTLIFPDLTFKVPAGWDRYRARLLDTFPGEAQTLATVIDIFRDVSDGFRAMSNRELDLASIATQYPNFLLWGPRPVTELFAEYGLSQRAQAVLLGEQGDYAVPPSRTPVGLAAGLTDHYMQGAFYPEGGGQIMAARLVEAIRAYGGEVRMRAPVDRIRIVNGRVAGVTLGKTGAEIDAPIVVSNADLKRTIHGLVGPQHFAPDTVARVDAFRMSLPLFVVYLGLNTDLVARGMPNTNYMMWGSYDIEAVYRTIEAGQIPDEDFVYVTITSIKDPANPRLAPHGHTNLQIMTVVPRDYDFWNVPTGPVELGDNAYHQDAEYRRRKAALAERLLTAGERIVPDLRQHIDWHETATPITQERFTRSTGGTSYGIEFAVDQMGPLRLGPRTEIPGLFLCGASIPSGHGIGGVMHGGVSAAAAVLDDDLMRRVVSGEVLGDPNRLPPLDPDFDPWEESH